MTGLRREERRLAWLLVLPAVLCIVLVALFPLAWTVWESLHLQEVVARVALRRDRRHAAGGQPL